MKNYLKSVILVLAFCSTKTAGAQVPVLNSYPSASAVIFLDFDGQTVTGTSWNYAGPIYCGASGLDNTQITTVFNRVAEDYRPFNVNVTTDSTKYFAAPANKRIRVVLTVTYDWYGAAGGVSFIGSFTWGDNSPAFVFTGLLNFNPKNIAEAASHEVGHTLGLYHQASYDANCVKLSDYNSGTGTGEIGWAPIMGVGYYENFTLWNNGPNSLGCTNYQSDLDIITTNNGFSYRTDDHAGTFAAATVPAMNGNQFTVSGVVERNTDQDMIRFDQPFDGRFQLSAIPYNVGSGNAGSNLDMQVTLFNASQTQLAVFNPGTLLNSVIDTTLNAGTYYLRVEGKGNIYAPNYASLGSYSLQGTMTAMNPLPLRRLELSGQINGDRHILNWLIDADEQVVSQTLEMSTDGRTFTTLTTPVATDRTYDYSPYAANTIQYRLRVLFDNGKQYYSNIVTLRRTSNSRPQLMNNLISNNTLIISSPGDFSYIVVDVNGKTISQGKLKNGLNNITAPFAANGMYFVRYTDGQQQWTDKMVRE